MRIKELSKQTNVSEHTLRYYEKIDLLVPKRLENNYRSYTDENVFDLKLIQVLQFAMFDLDSIKQVLHAFYSPPSDACNILVNTMLEDKIKELEHKIIQYQKTLQLLQNIPTASNAIEYGERKDEIVQSLTVMIDDVLEGLQNE